MTPQQQERDLSFIEHAMYEAIRQSTPEQQTELRAMSVSQSLAEFTRTLQQRFPQRAQYITEERVKHVLAYDQQHQAQTPPAHQVQPVSKPASPIAPASAPIPKPKAAKEEMWLIIAMKSKTMRFFAVSCEFIIFLGCLWLTLITIMPAATGWFHGGIDNFFLIALGFAVDAALPEAWLHVVDQYTDNPRKTTQLKWSIPIAIGMLILVVANFVYAKVAGTSGQAPTGALAILVNALLIARMFIGISYVTIRECQSFLDRKQRKQQPHDTPPLQPEAIEQQIATATHDLQTTLEHRLIQLTGEQSRLLASIDQVKQQTAIAPEVDIEAIIAGVVSQFEARFTSAMKRMEAEVKQRVSVSLAAHGTSGSVSHGQSETALPGPRLVPLPQRSTSPSPTKRPGGTQPLEQETSHPVQGETTDYKSTIYALLEKDNTLQVADLQRMTGCPKTTVWRHWNRYHEERGTRGSVRIVESETQPTAGDETA